MGISELPDKNRAESQRKHTDGNAQRPINAGSVQDPKQPDKGPCTDRQQHDRPALKDPDTWPALSRTEALLPPSGNNNCGQPTAGWAFGHTY